MTSLDPYLGLAERYDWMKGGNPAREQFFRTLFAERRVRKVLDCACGTGHDLILFNSLGCQVSGSDLSEAMLAQARKNLAAAGLDVPVRRADFCELPGLYDTGFDAVVCLSNAINEAVEEGQTLRALRSMRSVLRAGGILVLDQGQTDAGMRNPPRFDPTVNNRDFTRVLVTDYDGDIATVNILDFIHTDDTSDFIPSVVRIRIRLQESWRHVLGEAGFDQVQFLGDWEFTQYDKETSRRMIVVAQK